MGNNACCAGPQVMKHVNTQAEKDLRDEEAFYLSTLVHPIKKRINVIKPFHDELVHFSGMVKYGDDMFEGRLDEDSKATGVGKMYKADGSLFVGNFKNGKANGQGYYFTRDGSFYHGNLVDNKSEDQDGVLVLQDDTQFIGHFRNNVLDGKGVQRGEDYTYKGTFKKGKRIEGTLTWEKIGQKFEYIGEFDENNEFTNYAVLKQPTGTYEGEFKNGKKQGKGVYYYHNGLKYIGSYVNGEKQGQQGTIYNKDGTISYAGGWKEGFPHGRGSITKKNGQISEGLYEQGIDTRFLPLQS